MLRDLITSLLVDPEPIVAPTREIRIPVREPAGPDQDTIWRAVGAGVLAVIVMIILGVLGVKLRVWFAVAGVIALTVFVVKLMDAT